MLVIMNQPLLPPGMGTPKYKDHGLFFISDTFDNLICKNFPADFAVAQGLPGTHGKGGV